MAPAHGAIWKERGLLNSQGKSIKHAQEIIKLLEAVQLPDKVAIMHIKEMSWWAERQKKQLKVR